MSVDPLYLGILTPTFPTPSAGSPFGLLGSYFPFVGLFPADPTTRSFTATCGGESDGTGSWGSVVPGHSSFTATCGGESDGSGVWHTPSVLLATASGGGESDGSGSWAGFTPILSSWTASGGSESDGSGSWAGTTPSLSSWTASGGSESDGSGSWAGSTPIVETTTWTASGGGESAGEGEWYLVDHYSPIVSWTASGGGESNGQGEWDTFPGDPCELEMSENGLKRFLKVITLDMAGSFTVGLFSNDREPQLGDTKSRYTPCTFSGYNGEQLLSPWTAPSMLGVRAVSNAHQMVWTHDGGPVSEYVFGLYCLDASGRLAFAERFCQGPFLMTAANQTIKLDPEFYTRNVREDT